MAEKAESSGGRRGRRLRIAVWSLAATLWLLPLAAMQFTAEMAWTAYDFVVWGLMLLVACGTFELAARMTGNTAYRAAAGVAVAAAFILVWMNLAVGVIGDEDNPLNLLFGGVLAVGVIGAVLARFRPDGMARTLIAMAVVQAGVAVAAQAYGHFTWVLTAVFVGLWLISASLFRKAAREGILPEV